MKWLLYCLLLLSMGCSNKTKFTLSDSETQEANDQVLVKPNIEHVVVQNGKPVISISIDNNSSYQIDFMVISVSIYDEFNKLIIEGESNYIGLIYSNKIGPGDKSRVTLDNIEAVNSDLNNKINLFDKLNNKSSSELQNYKVNVDKWQLFEISIPGKK